MSHRKMGSRLPSPAPTSWARRASSTATSASAKPRIQKLTMSGGLLAVFGGILHLVAATLMRRDAWDQILDEGFVNTVTLDPSADELAVAEAYWFAPGSFGVPLLLLGGLVAWLAWRGQRVPGWLGCGVVAWAVLLGLLGGFDGGTILILLIGVLVVAGDRQARANTQAA
jgi:Family of unknown function (DUF6463)